LVAVAPPTELVEDLRASLPELPAARICRLEPAVGFDLAEGLVTSGRDRLYELVAGDRRAVANVIMNQLAGAGVDPDAVSPEELAKLVDARDRIPRAQFDEAISRAGEPGFSAEPYLAETSISDA